MIAEFKAYASICITDGDNYISLFPTVKRGTIRVCSSRHLGLDIPIDEIHKALDAIIKKHL